MLAYLHHTLSLWGGELNVPTPYSGGVALGFPLPKEGQPARGWRKKRKMKMQELQFVRSKESKWEGHRRLKVGLNERRCMGGFEVLGLTAYHRFPPLNPLTDGWWVKHMRLVPALKTSKRVGGTTRGNRKHTMRGKQENGGGCRGHLTHERVKWGGVIPWLGGRVV